MCMFRAFLTVSLSLLFFSSATAQFMPGTALSGMDDPMSALAVFDDGTGPALYATGDVFKGDGLFLNSIGKWNGTAWEPLAGGIGDPTADHLWDGSSLVVYDDGNGEALYVGGKFLEAGGIPANCVARWDGTAWSALGNGLDLWVEHLAVFDDGDGPALYATGAFPGVERWDGNTWQSISDSSSAGAMTVFDDGNGARLYAVGSFETPSSGTTNRVGAWDGTNWHPLQGPTGPNGIGAGVVRDMATYDDGSGEKLYLVGDFLGGGDVTSPDLVAWTGSAWQAVPSPPLLNVINTLTVYDDGDGARLVVAIDFPSQVSRVMAWDGQTWSEFQTPGRLAEGSINDLTVLEDISGQRLYAAGSFQRSGIVNKAFGVSQWDGQTWTHVGSSAEYGLDYDARAFAIYNDGQGEALYVGGHFNSAGNAFARLVARFDGTTFSGLRDPSGEGLVPPDDDFSDAVTALQTFDDGSGAGPRLFAGGNFSRDGQTTVRSLAAWDGTAWASLGVINGIVTSFTVFDDGTGDALYVGGGISTAGGVTVNGIAKWDGFTFASLDGPNGIGLGGFVHDLEVFDDGSGPAIYAVGSFILAGGVDVESLARWDPTNGWAAVGGFDHTDHRYPTSLEVFDDGSSPALFIGGGFTTVNGMTVHGIVKWDGTSFSPVSDTVGTGLQDNFGESGAARTLLAYDAGAGERLYVGGVFHQAGGRSAHQLASWDGTQWRALIGDQRVVHNVPRTGGGPVISGLFGYGDGEPTLLIGGHFSDIGGVASHYWSRYRETENVFADGFERGDVTAWSNSLGSP